MPPEITRSEYLEINGIPLATPAWEATDLSALYDAPAVRGDDRQVPYRVGVRPRRRIYDAKRSAIPIDVFGFQDLEGNAHSDPAIGLLANLDYLKREVFRPRQNATSAGTRPVRHVLPDESARAGEGFALPPFQPEHVGEGAMRIVLDLLIPAGVLRDELETEVTEADIVAATEITVPNPGTADQFELVIELSGTADQVRISSMSWDPDGDTYLDFLGSLGAGVEIDTAAFTAVRDGISVVGLIENSGHESWLPLLPGDNTLLVEPTGGDVTITVRHFGPYS